MLRDRAKITSHFGIPSPGHLWPILNRKILEIVLLLLRLRSIGSTKSNPDLGANSAKDLGANSAKLFLRGPLRWGPPIPQGRGHGAFCEMAVVYFEARLTRLVYRPHARWQVPFLVSDRKPPSSRARAKAALTRRRMQIARRCSPSATSRTICIRQRSQRWLQPGAADWGLRSGTNYSISF
jgi:hypothetical protein